MATRDSKKKVVSRTRLLGGEVFAAITAVEGLALTASGQKRMAEMKVRRLSPDRRRAEVLRAYASLKGR